MIDMRGIYHDNDFKKALKKFNEKLNGECKNNTDCEWSTFKRAFLDFSKNKCPICEDTLNRYDDIDHYRPKESIQYPFLECCYQNYMIMCSDCNRAHKRTSFPLYTNFKATNITQVPNEFPLIANPTHDNIFELFILKFIVSEKSNKRILILQQKDGLSDYQKEKAKVTIDIYGIGNCDVNKKIDNCRIEILELHYEKFIEFAKATKTYFNDKTNKEKRKKIAKILKQNPKLTSFGFYHFIINNQFEIAA